MSELSKRIRRDFAAGDMVRDAGLKTPDDVVRFVDISYGEDEKYNLLDVYRPKEPSVDHLPVIMIVHGGAWVYGDKEVYRYYGMSLAQRGFAVVNFSYRLAPESKFPAQLEDICAVFEWIYKNREEYGLDAGNVFAVGDSAGAHLLGLFAGVYSNPDYVKALKEKYPGAGISLHAGPDAAEDTEGKGSAENNAGARLRAVALNCGKYDLTKSDDADKDTPLLVADFFKDGGSREELELTCVTDWVTKDYPPVFMMTCPGDFLKYQAPFMEEALRVNSVPFVYRYYGNASEPLHHVFHCNIRLESARICNDDECGFFADLVCK
ncbi:MAG TPA: alpha/beta hydrolase [Lachnospiraceae bacterium]|nr:alpha/beta hydrolase [Lachnospiraceae bacterium]